MNRAHLMIVALVATLGPPPCSAQFGGGGMGGMGGMARPVERWKVEVKMADDRAFEGVLALGALEVECDLGHYAIKPEKIKEVRFQDQGDGPQIVGPGGMQVRGTIVTTSGEEFGGTIGFPREGIETDLGVLKPNPKKLRALTFKGKKAE